MTLYHDTFTTPFGLFSVAVDDRGALVATAFGGFERLTSRIAAKGLEYVADRQRTATVRSQVLRYAADPRAEFTVDLAAGGSAFQQRVWQALRRIPRGETRTYGDLARELASSPRAVGRANATNPICLIVPCHRVIGADGTLTGFAFGVETKQRLLQHEHAAM